MNELVSIQEDLKKLKSMMGAAATQMGADPKNIFVQKAVDIVPNLVIDFLLQGKIAALQVKSNEIVKSLDMASSAFRGASNTENKITPIIEAFSEVAFDTQTVVKTVDNYSKLVVGFSEQTVIDRYQVSDSEWKVIQAFDGEAMTLQELNANQTNFRQVASLAQFVKTFKVYLGGITKVMNRVVSIHDRKRVFTADQAIALGSACAYISKVADTLVGELRAAEKVRITIIPIEVEFEKL